MTQEQILEYRKLNRESEDERRSPKTHCLKIRQEYAEEILKGNKMFEIRNNDRGYKVGDTVIFDTVIGRGTTHNHVICEKQYEITYITNFKQKSGFVVFGIKEK